METEGTEEGSRTLGDILDQALVGIVFGNGFLAIAIFVIFVLAVVLSRTLKGGSL